MQSAAGVMIFAEPRFATAIIDERDLAGLADANDELDRVVDAAARAPPRHQAAVPGRLLPVGGDQARPVARRAAAVAHASCRHVRVLNYSGSGIETTFTQGEDACLAVAGAGAAGRRRRRAASLLVVGTLADVVEDQFRRLFDALGIGPVHFLPPRALHGAAAGRPGHAVPAGAALPGRHGARAGGARRDAPRRALPARRRGHDAPGCRPPRDALGVDADAISTASPRPRASARRAGAGAHRTRSWPGKRIFFFPDSQLEIPLARFLSRELGMTLVEVGTPYLHRQHLAARAGAAAGRHARCREGQDVDRQLDRCRAARPDLVGLRPRPGQSAGGRGLDDQVVDRTRLHADPGLRAGRRSGRTVRAPAACAARGWRSSRCS